MCLPADSAMPAFSEGLLLLMANIAGLATVSFGSGVWITCDDDGSRFEQTRLLYADIQEGVVAPTVSVVKFFVM